MRPQELYAQVGMTHEALSGIVDQVRQLVAGAEVWDRRALTVDDSSVITPAEAADAVAEELRAAPTPSIWPSATRCRLVRRLPHRRRRVSGQRAGPGRAPGA